MFTHNYIHLRAVRRGIKITEKYLNDQKDISQLDITKTDIKGRNIFHLGVQSTELLEFLLEKFEKVGYIINHYYCKHIKISFVCSTLFRQSNTFSYKASWYIQRGSACNMVTITFIDQDQEEMDKVLP